MFLIAVVVLEANVNSYVVAYPRKDYRLGE